MRSIPCATAGSRGCSTSDARRCLRGSSPSFRGPNGEGFCASQSRSAFRTRASVNTGVRQRSICGRWARSRRRSHGARSSSMYLHTNRYTTRSAGLWPRSPRAETRNGSSAGSETDVGGSRPRSGASPWRPCGTANGCVRGVIHGLRRRPRGSIIGFGHWVPDRRRPAIARPNLRRGSAEPLLRGLTCSAEGRAGVGSGPSALSPQDTIRMDPTAPIQRRTYYDRHREAGQSVASSQFAADAPQDGIRKDLLAPRGRQGIAVSPSAVLSPRGGGRFWPGGEKTKKGWGRPAQRSSDDGFPSPFLPSELSPSLPSIGFLITRFWTIGAGALVGPGGDIGPRAWILRAGAPATTAPPLGGR